MMMKYVFLITNHNITFQKKQATYGSLQAQLFLSSSSLPMQSSLCVADQLPILTPLCLAHCNSSFAP